MKRILILFLIVISVGVKATNYYIRASGTNGNGLTPETAFVSSSGVRVTAISAVSGDSIFFKRGDTFVLENALFFPFSGAQGNPIYIGAYGTGDKPVFTSFYSIVDWANTQGSVYYSNTPMESNEDVFTNVVTIDGKQVPMGRYPQTGWLIYESVGWEETSITDTELANSPSWAGAEAVIKKHVTGWMVDRNKILAHRDGKLTYQMGSSWQPIVGFGYFLQSDMKTLTYEDAWYFDKDNSALYMYLSDPSVKVVRIATVKHGFEVFYSNYLTFENLKFSGFNNYGFLNHGSHDVTIKNCDFEFTGLAACGVSPFDGGASYLTYDGNLIKSCGAGIEIKGTGDHMVVKNNVIDSVGLIPGMCAILTGDNAGDGIALEHNYSLVEYNRITNVGHSGIRIGGEYMTVRFNYVDGFAYTRNDAGGIYFWNPHGSDYKGCNVYNNICLNGNPVSSGVGSNSGITLYEWGIYLDEHSNNVRVENNTAANCPTAGFTILMSTADTLIGNISYNNGIQLDINSMWGTESLRDALITNNQFISKTATQPVFRYHSRSHDYDSIGVLDYNLYTRPVEDTRTFQFIYNYDAPVTYTLAEWKALSKGDSHSTKYTGTINGGNDFRFEYNNTNVVKTVSLPVPYKSLLGTTYNSEVNLLPFTSVVLLPLGSVIPPINQSGSVWVWSKGKLVMKKGKVLVKGY